MSKNQVSQAECLAWLKDKFPELHATAELDRSWVWLTGDALKPCKTGCECDDCKVKAETRKAIGLFGFSFCRKGHALPSGKTGTWGHSCQRPISFKRRDNSKPGAFNQPQQSKQNEDPLIAEAMAFLSQ